MLLTDKMLRKMKTLASMFALIACVRGYKPMGVIVVFLCMYASFTLWQHHSSSNHGNQKHRHIETVITREEVVNASATTTQATTGADFDKIDVAVDSGQGSQSGQRTMLQTLTSAERSIIQVVNKHAISVGDSVEILLVAVDVNDVRQTHGGDFLFALLKDANNYFISPGVVKDNNNGTYSIYFYAGREGTFYIDITLVHSAAAVQWLKDVYIPDENCFMWEGTFVTSKTRNIFSTCKVQSVAEKKHLNSSHFCFYGYGEKGLGHAALVCGRPTNVSDCNTLQYLKAMDGAKTLDDPVDRLLKGKEFTYLFNNSNYMTHVPEVTITISKGTSSNAVVGKVAKKQNLSVVHKGYWYKSNWISLVVNKTHWTMTKINQCFSGYNIIMLGDSTMEQWLHCLDDRFKANWKHPNKPAKDNAFLSSRVGPSFNVTVHRNRLCIHLAKKAPFRGPMKHFEPELLDRLPRTGNCKYLIVIGLAAHYSSWPLELYKQRLVTLKNAVIKLQRDCRARAGNVRVVIKMAHARDHPTFQARVHSNNWVFAAMNDIMKDVFGEINAIFVDIWDMVIAFPGKLDVHMPKQCTENEVDLFLSQVCPT